MIKAEAIRFLTKNRSLEFKGVIHELQGNGPGIRGLYVANRTWCQCRILKGAQENQKRPNCPKCAEQKKFWIEKFRALDKAKNQRARRKNV